MKLDKYNEVHHSILKLCQAFKREPVNSTLLDRDFEQAVIDVLSNEKIQQVKYLLSMVDEITWNEREMQEGDSTLYESILAKRPSNAKHYNELTALSKNALTTLIPRFIGSVKKRLRIIEKDDEQSNGNTQFDVFFSHKYKNRLYNIILFYVLTVYYGLSVYIDWIYDGNLNRNNITKTTVRTLKNRMKQSKTLLFFNIDNTRTTNWMTWEVGYFGGLGKERIGLIDLNNYSTGRTNVEVLSSNSVIQIDFNNELIESKHKIRVDMWVNQ